MRVEIIATGSELTLGEQVDTNSPYIARQLRDIGLPLAYVTHVGDDLAAMVDAVRVALNRADIVLIGGGLGPTVDDVTRAAVARAVDRPLVFQPELLAQIEARFRAFGRAMTDNNRQQAYVPDGALPIENPVGTAPAFIVEQGDRSIVCLPGVPHELVHLLDHAVIPYLQSRYHLHDVIVVRTLHTIGEGESRIDSMIHGLEPSADVSLGLSAKQGQVDVRLAARADSRGRAQSLVAALEAQVRDRLGGLIFGADDDTLEGVIAGLLAGRHMSVTAVELGTGGSISRRLSENRLGSDLFRDGLVLPDVAALRRVLAVEVEPADPVGLVVRAAQRARLLYDASLGLAAMVHESGPDGGPGMALVAALAWADGSHHLERRYGGHFGLAPQWMASLALGMLWKHLRAG